LFGILEPPGISVPCDQDQDFLRLEQRDLHFHWDVRVIKVIKQELAGGAMPF
jgi:hypothetical protein